MKENTTAPESINCSKYRPPKDYTHTQELIDNLPYIFMAIIGSIIQFLAITLSIWGAISAVIYFIYAIVGAFWIIIFVCPYCNYYDTRACPCGYGQIAAKLRRKSDENRFSEKFKKHIPVIVPLWVIPVITGGISLYFKFNNLLLTMLIAFIVNSYLILPLVARIYGCGHCPQKADCPWMI